MMTDQETNEALARVLGYPSVHVIDGVVLVANEGDPVTEEFDPATKPGTAMFALEIYCRNNIFDIVLEKEDGPWECQIWHLAPGGTKILKKATGNLCGSICEAILGAAAKTQPEEAGATT